MKHPAHSRYLHVVTMVESIRELVETDEHSKKVHHGSKASGSSQMMVESGHEVA